MNDPHPRPLVIPDGYRGVVADTDFLGHLAVMEKLSLPAGAQRPWNRAVVIDDSDSHYVKSSLEELAAAPSTPAEQFEARTFYLDWESAATEIVAALRSEAGRNPHDRALSDLVGELSTRSEEFRTRWAAHNVRFHLTGVKHLHHPVVGDLHLDFERMDISADTGLTLFIHTAEPGSKSEQALSLLASWTATLDQETAEATKQG
jgi:hypothetical protein